MKERKKEERRRNTIQAGVSAWLAHRLGTPVEEYQEALERDIYFPAAGVPDEEAIKEVFGFTREQLHGK